jgi:hypothetical protein
MPRVAVDDQPTVAGSRADVRLRVFFHQAFSCSRSRDASLNPCESASGMLVPAANGKIAKPCRRSAAVLCDSLTLTVCSYVKSDCLLRGLLAVERRRDRLGLRFRCPPDRVVIAGQVNVLLGRREIGVSHEDL